MEPLAGASVTAPRRLVDDYEAALPVPERRARGVHHTPERLARALVEQGIAELGRLPRQVLDPSCGGGAFLLAAADVLVGHGVSPIEVLSDRLVGVEVDPAAAAVARAALAKWGTTQGIDDPPTPRIVVGDSLARPADDWTQLVPGGADLVVGNPPFLSPLSLDTAPGADGRAARTARFGEVGRYVDAAALFLLVGLDAAADDGVVVMVQPRSVLTADDAGPVRAAAVRGASLAALWTSDAGWFSAAVQVCAPVLRKGVRPGRTRVLAEVPVVAHGTVPHPDARSWGPVLAAHDGVPPVALDPGRTLTDMATATAGFRDEFYAIAAATVEADGEPSTGLRPVATVGMVDVGRCSSELRAARIGGRRFVAPHLDLSALADSSPPVARWVAARSVPKVLLATQTRIAEAVADPTGRLVPLTPLVSVEPRDPGDVWRTAAVLGAPPVSALAASLHLGSGRSARAVRWSARRALDVPLPVDDDAWAEGAEVVVRLQHADTGERPGLLAALGRVMTVAYGLRADDPVVDWWTAAAR